MGIPTLVVLYALGLLGCVTILLYEGLRALFGRRLGFGVILSGGAVALSALGIHTGATLVAPCGGPCRLDEAVATARHRTVLLDWKGRQYGVLEAGKAPWVPLEAFPSWLPDLVLSKEDRRFYAHRGVDPVGVARAMLATARGLGLQGSSTVPMQGAQITVGRFGAGRLPKERSVRGKLAETAVGAKLLELLGHDALLELYLNEVPMGPVSGLPAAAMYFFGVHISEVTFGQGAILAVMIRAPGALNPRLHPEAAASARRRFLLGELSRSGGSSPAMRAALGEPVVTIRRRRPATQDFTDALRRELRGEMRDTVMTTLDLDQQTRAWTLVERRIVSLGGGAGDLQGVFVSIGDRGAVRGYVAGRPSAVPLWYDRLAFGRIRLASTLKPFLLAAALQANRVFLGEPLSSLERRANLPMDNRWLERLRPRAQLDESVIDALARSENWLAVCLLGALPDLWLERLRLAGLPSAERSSPSTALGTATVGPLDHALSFHSLVGNGVVWPARYTEEPVAQPREEFWSPWVVHRVREALERVVESGTAAYANTVDPPPGVRIGAKTGSVDGNHEFLIAGFVTGGVETRTGLFWVGYDKPRRITRSGHSGLYLGRTWARMMVGNG